MHIFFSGIGGAGANSIALLAHQAGYKISGSDAADSATIDYLKQHGISDVYIGQTGEQIAKIHAGSPIDLFVYTSALPITNPKHPELEFCKSNGIEALKHDEFLARFVGDKKLKMIAVAGTHGKSTTTAMLVWLAEQLKVPASWSVGAKMDFAETGHYQNGAQYFICEADEFDRKFLSFYPKLAIITGVDWDHPDIYPTREAYIEVFQEFLDQSESAIMWQADVERLALEPEAKLKILDEDDSAIDAEVKLAGRVNREDAWLAAHAFAAVGIGPVDKNIEILNKFPGLSRRFEMLAPNIYTDYAHTPAKIRGALETAKEVIESNQRLRLGAAQDAGEQQTESYPEYGEGAAESATQRSAKSASRVEGSAGKQASAAQKLVVVYEGLHNTRQHFIKDELVDLFDGVKKLYVVPSFLAREDPNLHLLTPVDLVNMLSNKAKAYAEPAELDNKLLEKIKSHAGSGDLVLALSAGSAGSLDEWLRKELS